MEASELGGRLRMARQARGLSQRAVAEALGVPRTAVTQFEAGNRSVSTLELTRLSALYFCPVTQLLQKEEGDEEGDVLEVLSRIAPGLRHSSAHEPVNRCVHLCREGTLLRRLLGVGSRSGFPSYETRGPRTSGEAVAQGEDIANQERHRLYMGNGPISRVSALLASQGIWTSGVDLPPSMSGLFLRHSTIGCAILVHASPPRGRKRLSYAHEYAHALMDRDETVRISSTDHSSEMVERRANAFAVAFLMPRHGVEEALRPLAQGLPSHSAQTIFDVASGSPIEVGVRSPTRSQRITYQDLALLAHHFGVSYQAALYRLKSLRYLSPPDAESLLGQEHVGRQYLKILMYEEEDKPQYRHRAIRSEMAHLAIEAYRRGEISRDRLLDRFRIRLIVSS